MYEKVNRQKVLLLNKSLGSTWNKMHYGIQDGGFCNFLSKVVIYFSLVIIKTWAKVCWNGNQCKAHCTLGGKQSSDDKEINTASETPASTKRTCKY